jgi:hypothetical protein
MINIIGKKELISIRNKLVESIKELDRLIQLQEENLNIKENKISEKRKMFIEDREEYDG